MAIRHAIPPVAGELTDLAVGSTSHQKAGSPRVAAARMTAAMLATALVVSACGGGGGSGSDAASAPASVVREAQPDRALIQKSNLVYVGAFRVPQGTSDQTTFNYGGTALAYNPANNSLFMTGHDQQQLSAEIKIPTLVNSTNINNLATATIIQSFRDVTEGRIESINHNDPNAKKIGGHLVYNGKLYVSAFAYYDGDGTQSASHFVRPLSLSTSGQVQGPVRVGSQYPGFVSGYMTPIPQEWRAHFGGPALTGNCCIAIAGIQSNGPAVSVFDPENIGRVSPVPATPVLGYPYGNILGPGETTTNSLYNMSTVIRGAVFPSGSRSVLFFGRIGIGPYCYGGGDQCGDPADPYKGTHAYPYVYQVWAYDANDLLAVKNGSKLQYEIKPYATWQFNLPFEGNGTHFIGGVAYDENTRNLYVSQQCEDENCAPIIHAFRVNL